MNTQSQTEPEVKPAIRGDIVASLTTAEAEAAMLRLLAEAIAVNPGITVISLSARKYTHDDTPRIEWSGHGVNSACDVSCSTLDRLVASLDRQIGPSNAAAQRLREK